MDKKPRQTAKRGPSGLVDLAVEWEFQQNVYRPERDAGLAALVECGSVAADAGHLIVDLACGTGSVMTRVLARHPNGRVIGLDRDPVLLAIAGKVFQDDGRVTLAQADLADPTWLAAVTEQPGAVLTAAAVHWLDEHVVRTLYRQLADLLPTGGIFANLDWVPVNPPLLASFCERVVSDRETRQLAAGAGMSWSGWWSELARHEDLDDAFAERDSLELARSAEFIRPAEWHETVLRAAGFTEIAVIWRSFSSAVLVAVR